MNNIFYALYMIYIVHNETKTRLVSLSKNQHRKDNTKLILTLVPHIEWTGNIPDRSNS